MTGSCKGPIQCCVGAVVCTVEEIGKWTLFRGGGGGEKCVQNARKLILLPSVSTLLSPIVVSVQYEEYANGQLAFPLYNQLLFSC